MSSLVLRSSLHGQFFGACHTRVESRIYFDIYIEHQTAYWRPTGNLFNWENFGYVTCLRREHIHSRTGRRARDIYGRHCLNR